jgi:hypothetical protein
MENINEYTDLELVEAYGQMCGRVILTSAAWMASAPDTPEYTTNFAKWKTACHEREMLKEELLRRLNK